MGIIHNVIGGLDLSDVTLDSASKLLYGVTAFDKDENLITGSMPNKGAYTATGTPSGNNSVNVAIPKGYHNGEGYITADGSTAYSAGDSAGYSRGVSATKKGTAGTAQVLSGYTFTNASSVNASGSMTDRGAWTGTGTPTGNNQTTVTIPKGYHNGSGYVVCKGQTAYSAGYSAGSSASKTSKVSLWSSSAQRGAETLTIALGAYVNNAIQIDFANPTASIVLQSSIGIFRIGNSADSVRNEYARDIKAYKSGSNLKIELSKAWSLNDGHEIPTAVIPIHVWAYSNFSI